MDARPKQGRARWLAPPLPPSLRAELRSICDDLVATIFPSDCRICDGPLLNSTALPICDACRSRIHPQPATLCDRCSEALDVDMESARLTPQLPAEGLLCHTCRAVPPMFERSVAHALYQDELREMVHLLKYERMRGLAGPLGAMLAKCILNLEAQAARELIVVAVPLFPAKERQRGYNQSELLADAAIAELGRLRPAWQLHPTPGVLRRRRDTDSQFAFNPRQRRANVEGAFAADAAALTPGCEVLLVDDIYTTGATARECARVLRRAGAGKVWVATLARAQSVRVAMWDEIIPRAPQGFG